MCRESRILFLKSLFKRFECFLLSGLRLLGRRKGFVSKDMVVCEGVINELVVSRVY